MILLCFSITLALCACLLITKDIWYYVKRGIKYTLTDTSFTAEWDFNSPLTQLKLLKLFIQSEFEEKTRNKYIREYNRLKESMKDKYDMSDFPDFK